MGFTLLGKAITRETNFEVKLNDFSFPSDARSVKSRRPFENLVSSSRVLCKAQRPIYLESASSKNSRRLNMISQSTVHQLQRTTSGSDSYIRSNPCMLLLPIARNKRSRSKPCEINSKQVQNLRIPARLLSTLEKNVAFFQVQNTVVQVQNMVRA